MWTDRVKFWFAAVLLPLGLSLGLAAAHAQNPNDFRLPPPSPTATAPRVQGPVDRENPIAAPRPSPRPDPAAQPQTAGSPAAPATGASSPAASPTSTSSPQTAASRAAGTPAPRRADSPAPAPTRPQAQPASRTATPSPALPPASEAATTPLPTSSVAAPATSASLPPASEVVGAARADWLSGPWLKILGGIAALAVLIAGAGWWQRRRAARPAQISFEPPTVAQPAAEPRGEPVATPPHGPAESSVPSPATLPEPAFAPAPAQRGLSLVLEAQRMSASLVNTTLTYKLRLTNHGETALTALAIEGDMIAAHASLPPERQLADPAQKLNLRHAVVSLAPGETAEFSGDIRLPLSAITPIRAGVAAYFVPLARFRVEAGPSTFAQTFVVGEVSADPAAALRPFRLDLGPRTYSRVGQRAVG